ncbi:MAG: ABC transporter substrate-binding protein [Candidatus Promineifilaceae bacterium]
MIILQRSVQLGDPHMCSDAKNRLNLLTAIFDTLVRRDLDGRFVGLLATAWQVTDDAKTWTLQLRDDVVFHNGDQMCSADVVASIQRACSPEVGGELGTEGVWASYIGNADICALDTNSVQIILTRPMADLFELLCAIPIMPQRVLPDVPNTLIGSGPYQLANQTAQAVTLTAFADSKTRHAAYPELIWQAEPDAAQRIAALKAGEADLITDLLPADAKQLPHLLTQQSNLCVAFLINCAALPDKRVRQALNYAIDIDHIIETAADKGATALSGPLTPLHFGCDPSVAPFEYNPAKARALLQSADFNRKLIIDLPTRLPDEAPILGQLLTNYFAAIGLEVELRNHADRTTYAHMVKAKQINDLCCFDSSPLSTYRVLREKINSDFAGPWWQGYDNPQVNTLLDQASQTTDESARQAIYYDAYAQMSADAPWVFLYRPTLYWGVQDPDSRVQISPEGLLRFEQV